jgi:hypothetical protein
MEPPNPVVSAESLPLVTRDTSPETLDAEGEQLRNLAAQSDNGFETPETVEAAEKPQDSTQDPARATGAETTDKPDSPETSAERDEKGRFLPKAEAAGTEEPQKQETPYDKAKKEQERQKSVLANFEAEKQRERAAIAAEKQQIAQARYQLQQQAAQGQRRIGSQGLWEASAEFDKQALQKLGDGDLDGAREKLDWAAKSRNEAQKAWYYEQQQAYNAQVARHRQKWEAEAQQVIHQNPELFAPGSETDLRMKDLLYKAPIFGQVEDGFKWALAAIQSNQKDAELSGLREENKKLKQQIKEDTERTAISGSGAQPHMESKGFDQMSEAEQEDYLRRNAGQWDRERFAS